MANTTNLDLVKPAGTDHALISVLNSNSDKIDEFAGKTNDSLSAEQNGLAYIVGNTNTTGGTLVVGQFVYVKGHSTIAEGLRKVTASISANASITTSNTDACSEGGLNALNSNIGTLSNQMATYYSLEKTGTDWLELPSDAKDIVITLYHGTSGGVQPFCYTFYMHKFESGIIKNATSGFYVNASSYGIGQITIDGTNHRINILTMQIGGTDYASTSKIVVNYRRF